MRALLLLPVSHMSPVYSEGQAHVKLPRQAFSVHVPPLVQGLLNQCITEMKGISYGDTVKSELIICLLYNLFF